MLMRLRIALWKWRHERPTREAPLLPTTCPTCGGPIDERCTVNGGGRQLDGTPYALVRCGRRR